MPGKPTFPRGTPFWDRVDKTGECWLWLSSKHPSGVGYVQFRGKPSYAPIVAWIESHGPIPEGMEICHHCDTPACVRPEHIFAATHAENMKDMQRKGRSRRKETHCHRGHEFARDGFYWIGTQRRCRPCQRTAMAAYRTRRRNTEALLDLRAETRRSHP